EADPARRYQRAVEIKQDLQRFAHTARAHARRSRRMRLPMAAAALVAIALTASTFFLLRERGRPAAAPARRSIAVLPFKPLGAVPREDNYIGLALADALITELGMFKTMAVRPFSATGRYGADRDPVAAGRELGAELVLDGATERVGDRLRVTVS